MTLSLGLLAPVSCMVSIPSFFFFRLSVLLDLHSFPTRRSSDLNSGLPRARCPGPQGRARRRDTDRKSTRLNSYLVCRLLLEKKKIKYNNARIDSGALNRELRAAIRRKLAIAHPRSIGVHVRRAH